ncbi:hypothetical protein NDU88_007690 [Pleurodeles waltl]|uniref:Uncharacterized protein n=1 Tax=Pleurodeles waltl TaxID=8319 RepID=A0AAV7NTV5_PLEWA|nr:hypothetical protein NDU88_007690 [Pleurodeles waltl]
MWKRPGRGTDDDLTFWELLLDYTERLHAVERPGCWGVRLGCRAREEVLEHSNTTQPRILHHGLGLNGDPAKPTRIPSDHGTGSHAMHRGRPLKSNT